MGSKSNNGNAMMNVIKEMKYTSSTNISLIDFEKKNSNGETALLMSYINPRTSRNPKIKELLIEFGADVYTTDAQNSTLLHHAAYKTDSYDASWTISMAGMDIIQKENIYGFKAVDIAMVLTLYRQNIFRGKEIDHNMRNEEVLRTKQAFEPKEMPSFDYYYYY